MVTQLTDRNLKVGEELLLHLDSKKRSIVAAFWMYSSTNGTWKLVFASPEVRKDGPKTLYHNILSQLLKYNDRPLSLSDVSFINDRSNIITSLRMAIRTKEGISNIRFSNNYINGILFEDLYIYRIL